MPDLFPPIEPRSIIGTGMAADPDAIGDLQEQWARRERANPPKRHFKQVLEEAPEEKKETAPEEKPAEAPVRQKEKSASQLYEDSLNSAIGAQKAGVKTIPVAMLPRAIR